MSTRRARSILYKLARGLGDCEAVRKGRIAKRLLMEFEGIEHFAPRPSPPGHLSALRAAPALMPLGIHLSSTHQFSSILGGRRHQVYLA